ncbi:MAG: hypothetical protein KJ042_08060 [Deltaproteobacteria bacterium]|nr:hypothetical protein [Deltaproteobacteria bacterium]
MVELRDQIHALGRLQEIDSRIDRLTDENRSLPVKIAQFEARVEKALRELEAAQAGVEELQKRRRDKERELQDGEARLASDRKKIMNAHNETEYQALQKEIAHHETANDARSEEILILLERIEQDELAVKKARLVHETTRTKADVEIAKIRERLAQVPGELTEAVEERKGFMREVDAPLLKRYDQLRAQKGGVAIAKANGGTCQGCHITVSPLVVNKLQVYREVIQCANCRRILYWDGPSRVNTGAVQGNDA